MKITWEKIKWPYNDESPYSEWDCYKAKIGRETIILHPGQWSLEGWSFVVKRNYSGFLPGITDIEQAKKHLELKFKPLFS